MTKQKTNKDNIILFPDLEKRLLERGMERLKEKNFREAIELLEQIRSFDSENSEAYIGLVLAYFESGQSTEAKTLVEEMLKKGIGDYIQVVDLYIMVLIQLSEYDVVVTTLEALLEEKEIPKEKYEHFSKLLHFSRNMVEEHSNMEANEAFIKEAEGERLSLFTYKDPKDQMLIAARLAKENIRPYIQEVKKYLQSEEGHPFQKSLLLNILREQDYNQQLEVKKFELQQSFTPSELPEIHELDKIKDVSAALAKMLENEDPVLCENIKSMVERHFFLIYPFNPYPEDASAWAAAYHFIANSYYGHEDSLAMYADKYGSIERETEEALYFIKKLEEISYPIN
ncbi:tetratricopeptide repeat protein [Bacillus sp. B15-48]|uniref:tetratricopeptide repeat protein n=1 Tax=Bacillus sp. B15-48 TaxID=1548601 RepID=UPI00193FDA6B|nr:tetratricopeptide repeat protein [Bacillus sp. B15-48]MBM4762471.1 tetratricopeptide repeat protein [Bacillus sp. B15-48]